MMHRFFIPPDWISGDRVTITGDQGRQLKTVLRIGVGEQITVLDNTGWEYRTQILDIKRDSVICSVVGRSKCPNDPEMRIFIYQSVLKARRMDYAVQKCTEIGVSGFVLVISERCVAGRPSHGRVERWRQIIREAAEQSGAGRMPNLNSVMDFKQACERAEGASLIPWEDESGTGIRAALSELGDVQSINVFIGPEGGYSMSEIELARRKGLIPVCLGKRLLRAETAGLVAATAILYEMDELQKTVIK